MPRSLRSGWGSEVEFRARQGGVPAQAVLAGFRAEDQAESLLDLLLEKQQRATRERTQPKPLTRPGSAPTRELLTRRLSSPPLPHSARRTSFRLRPHHRSTKNSKYQP